MEKAEFTLTGSKTRSTAKSLDPNGASILDLVASFVGKNDLGENDEVQRAVEAGSKSQSSNCLNHALFAQPEQSTNNVTLTVVIFTKDRPWQLEQLFQSMQLDKNQLEHFNTLSIQFVVVARVTKDFVSHYETVHAKLGQSIAPLSGVSLDFVLEDEPDDSFEACMLNILNHDDTALQEKEMFWMFLTDDCILLVSLWELLETAVLALASQRQDACFLSRLHPGISWCQTRNQPSLVPHQLLRYQPCNNTGVYEYPLSSAAGEWAYPWDLSGGVYPFQLIKQVLQQLQGTPALSHPNRLEIGGNEVLQKMPLTCCIPTRPNLLVLAINRVQTLFQAPLACNKDQEEMLDVKILLDNLENGVCLDLDRYRNTVFDSSHIGHVWYEGDAKEGTRELQGNDTPVLSVLIPIRSGPPRAAAHAIASILMQPIEEWQQYYAIDGGKTSIRGNQHVEASSASLRLSPLQIVLVDDGCIDGSIDAMLSTAQDLVETLSNVHLTILDHRLEGMEKRETKGQDKTVCIEIEVYSSPRPGISAALNWGLKQCRSDLVARMDADDISSPGRLVAQVRALECQPSTSLLGTHSLVFRPLLTTKPTHEVQPQHTVTLPANKLPYLHLVPKENDNTDTTTINVRPSLYPTSPGFAGWTMLFSCCLAHPSVMFRKIAIEHVGGYDETYSSAEDYHLWLRLTQSDCRSVASLPRIGLWHRKHLSGLTHRSKNALKQTQEALRACAEAIEEILKSAHSSKEKTCSTISPETLAALRNPNEALSHTSLDSAAELLAKLEAAFLYRHKENLTAREAELVRQDCDARIGELATLVVTNFGAKTTDFSRAWELWVKRCPRCTLETIALLCHCSQ